MYVGNIPNLLRDASDITRFSAVHMVKTHFLLKNLLISEPSLDILEKSRRRLARRFIIYNIIVIYYFWINSIGSSFVLPNIFLIQVDNHCETQSELTDILKNNPNLLNFHAIRRREICALPQIDHFGCRGL